ncbi:hypothetical protein NCC49_005606 [Naganishia albida]|nr:hypothetical protein NCC49_005606 [Naganishia albida]
MSSAALPTIFRLAEEEGFETVATLHASIIDVHPTSGILYVEGRESIWVLVRDEIQEIVGEVWMKKCRREDRLPPRGNLVPEGYDRGEYAKVSVPLFQMLDDLMDRYQEYIYLGQFDIATTAQRQGMYRETVLSIVHGAREKKLNIALIAPAGNYAFCAAFGCLPIGEPIKIGQDNTVEGVS